MDEKRRLPLIIEQSAASVRYSRARISQEFNAKKGESVTCRKGCAHCCSYPFSISLWEGMTLYKVLRDGGLWRSQLRQDMEKHSTLTLGTPPELWLLAEIPCPLLREGTCRTYEHRPFRCRVTVSERLPEMCRAVYFGADTFVDAQKEREQFDSLEKAASRASRDHVRGMEQRFPLSTAVLLGHQIVEGQIRLEEIPQRLLRMLVKAT